MRKDSQIDPSVNFIEDALEGFIESRYVRKYAEYFICYLSSQTGCNKGCRFCHLTTTKQTKVEDVLSIDYLGQAAKVLKHYNYQQEPAKYMHFNFMARGEALSNTNLITNADSILVELGELVHSVDPNLGIKFNISTILPKGLNKGLEEIFKLIHPTIYYSLYSQDPSFRQKWMPQAMDLVDALPILKNYQDFSKKVIKIHHCFIEGENDSPNDVIDWCYMLHDSKIKFEFNLVRYNPFSEEQGKESSEKTIHENLEYIKQFAPVKIIPRVGFDVQASCGTFHTA